MFFAAFIRGINVGGHGKLAMVDLREICESIGLKNVKTYLQSGNVVFEAKAADAKKLESAIGKAVMLRTAEELRAVVEANPFQADARRDPARVVVMFLASAPAAEAAASLQQANKGPEQAQVIGRELYVWYPNGQGTSKFTGALIEKKLGVAATARNFNTVAAMLELLTAPAA